MNFIMDLIMYELYDVIVKVRSYLTFNVILEIFWPQCAKLTQFSKKAIFYSFTISSVNFYLNLGEQKSVQSVFFTHFWNRTVGTLWVYGGLMSIF